MTPGPILFIMYEIVLRRPRSMMMAEPPPAAPEADLLFRNVGQRHRQGYFPVKVEDDGSSELLTRVHVLLELMPDRPRGRSCSACAGWGKAW